jgi:hypothetical protein
MFRPSKEEQMEMNFGKYQEEVEELLRYLSRVPPALYSVLGFFTEYKIKNKGFIKEHYGDVEKD